MVMLGVETMYVVLWTKCNTSILSLCIVFIPILAGFSILRRRSMKKPAENQKPYNKKVGGESGQRTAFASEIRKPFPAVTLKLDSRGLLPA